ncbi:MAG: alpha/beta fold hydrolase [Acidimicrobiales bacterium]
MQTVQSADGTTIVFEAEGEGPALVLVTGAFCDRHTSAALAARLASRFTVYRYDRRGRGDSTDAATYSVAREVEDLDAVITAAGGTASAYGHSSGAVLVLVAAAAGSAIDKLAAYEPPFVEDNSRPRHGSDLADRLSDLVAAGHRGEAADRFLTEAVGLPPQALDSIHRSPGWPAMLTIAHTLAYDVILSNNQTIPDGLERISVPVLLLAGGASPEWARSAIESLALVIPRSQTVVLDGQTHGVADDAIVPVIEDFLL